MALIFLNGGGMSGGPLHHQLQGTPLVCRAHSAPKYRYYSVGDRFPAMHEVAEGGASVVGELYDLPLTVLRDHLLPSEPKELELGVIELAGGGAALATVLRESYVGSPELIDITGFGDWRAYQALAEFNAADPEQARAVVSACLAVPRWVDAMLSGRPYADADSLLAAARAALAQPLSGDEIRGAIAQHPRIGESADADATSRAEQSGVDDSTAELFRAANAEYEAKFGHVYLVCASGRAGEELLADLRGRLHNDPRAELDVAGRELAKIALLRLEREVQP